MAENTSKTSSNITLQPLPLASDNWIMLRNNDKIESPYLIYNADNMDLNEKDNFYNFYEGYFKKKRNFNE